MTLQLLFSYCLLSRVTGWREGKSPGYQCFSITSLINCMALSRSQVFQLICTYNAQNPGLYNAQNPGVGRSLETIIYFNTLFVEAKIAIANLPFTAAKCYLECFVHINSLNH